MASYNKSPSSDAADSGSNIPRPNTQDIQKAEDGMVKIPEPVLRNVQSIAAHILNTGNKLDSSHEEDAPQGSRNTVFDAALFVVPGTEWLGGDGDNNGTVPDKNRDLYLAVLKVPHDQRHILPSSLTMSLECGHEFSQSTCDKMKDVKRQLPKVLSILRNLELLRVFNDSYIADEGSYRLVCGDHKLGEGDLPKFSQESVKSAIQKKTARHLSKLVTKRIQRQGEEAATSAFSGAEVWRLTMKWVQYIDRGLSKADQDVRAKQFIITGIIDRKPPSMSTLVWTGQLVDISSVDTNDFVIIRVTTPLNPEWLNKKRCCPPIKLSGAFVENIIPMYEAQGLIDFAAIEKTMRVQILYSVEDGVTEPMSNVQATIKGGKKDGHTNSDLSFMSNRAIYALSEVTKS